MQSQQGLWFRSWRLSTAEVSVLGIYRVDKRDKSNRSTKRIVISLCSNGFWSVWGEIKLPLWNIKGREKMRIEKVYARYFVLWEDTISGLRKVISHSLQARPPLLCGEWEPSPGLHSPPGSALCPAWSLQECFSRLVSPLAGGPGDVNGPLWNQKVLNTCGHMVFLWCDGHTCPGQLPTLVITCCWPNDPLQFP